MISSAWILLGIGAAGAGAMMAALWLVQLRIKDASHVDVGWTYGLGGLAVLYAVLADGDPAHRVLIAALAAVWSLRLGTYLLVNRVLRSKEEDGRYQELRSRWGASAHVRFFAFFQAQALLDVIFAVPFLAIALNPHDGLERLEWAAAAIWLVAVVGEATADLQLARWRKEPASKGKTCRAGLWRLSRHPNYFFEWLVWVAFALAALAAPWGWLGLVAPALLLFLLFRVTGIPATEEQALRSRGEDYRRYQQETSAFVPWFPKKQATA